MANFKIKSIWKDEDKAKIDAIKNQIAQLETTLTNLNNEVVKLSGNQTINGKKTFNDSLRFPNREAILSNETNITVAKISNQQEKFIKFDFVQTTGGFQNYGWLQLNAKFSTDPWKQIMAVGFKNQDNAATQGVWMNCSNNKFSFEHPTTVSNVATPTNNNDVANKYYVDAIKTKIKEIVNASSDFNDFKTRIGGW